MKETELLNIDEEYVLTVDAKNRRYVLASPTSNFVKNGNIMTMQQLANAALNADKMTQEMYEMFVVQYMANAILKNDWDSLQITFDSAIFMSGTIGYCTYCSNPRKVFFSPEVLIKTAKMRFLFTTLNAIEHEFAHIKDFEIMPISYQKFDNENGRKASLPATNVFAEVINAVARDDKELAKKFRAAVRERYTNSNEERFARGQAIFRNYEFSKTMEEEAKRLVSLAPKRQAFYLNQLDAANKYVKENMKKEVDAQFLSDITQNVRKQDWELFRKVTRDVIREYCDVNPKNKYVRNGREFCSMTQSLGVTLLALDCEELACQENYDNLFDYYSGTKIDENNLMVLYLLIGLKHNKRSQEMLEKMFKNRSLVEKKTILDILEDIRYTLDKHGGPEYPRTDIKYFRQAAVKNQVLSWEMGK